MKAKTKWNKSQSKGLTVSEGRHETDVALILYLAYIAVSFRHSSLMLHLLHGQPVRTSLEKDSHVLISNRDFASQIVRAKHEQKRSEEDRSKIVSSLRYKYNGVGFGQEKPDFVI
ncbi:uncharacterized protein LOC143151612 [Ptiloglossa arizonensis]|uniref:uncharacterized protein LOC143151612 n=1 Tax=Ptiloglossa arizonensis TaxID=3350558 RepID=UPI003F9FE234